MSSSALSLPPAGPEKIGRILVIRRNRMGDMICTLPLLNALRQRFPAAYLRVVCDALGEPVARASGAVDDVHVLKKGLNRWHMALRNVSALRGFDLAIGVKGGFDKVLAAMVRLSGARSRIGFQAVEAGSRSFFYTHPLPLPPPGEHQVETCARLLAPLGITTVPLRFKIECPAAAQIFADDFLKKSGLGSRRYFAVFNLSSNRGEYWPAGKYAEIIRWLAERGGAVIFSCLPTERKVALELAALAAPAPVAVAEPPSLLCLAALLERATLLLTPEGGCAHLAAATGTPAIVLWPPRGPLVKWRSRGALHFDLLGKPGMADIEVAEVKRLGQKILEEHSRGANSREPEDAGLG